MLRKSMITIAVAVMSNAAFGSADYMFPTAYPSGVQIDTVKQIVSFIWDDNAYSGLKATNYESVPGETYKENSWVGGMKPWGATSGVKNTMSIEEGDFGMSWAISTLAARDLPLPAWSASGIYKPGMQCTYNGDIWEANYEGTAGAIPEVSQWGGGQWKKIGPVTDNYTRQNPDGTPLQFTFNVISGGFVPIFGTDEKSRESRYGFYVPNEIDKTEFPHLADYKKVATCWGREQMVKRTETDEGNINGEMYGRINDVFKFTRDMGHEIGNHTIDHLESNSGLPNDETGFGRWGGEGFAATQVMEVSYADTTFTVDEAEEFGRTPGITWHKMGWAPFAGRMLSQNAWKGLIELGEVDLETALDLTPKRNGGTIGGFRAPRLEVNSGLFYAMKELGYLYDCGLEEGYEYHVDGTNFYWPYTLENGSPNSTYQRTIGEQVAIDSLPSGLWQFPVNAMIVPENIRAEVWANYEIISRADGEIADWDVEREYWINESGKVTGFDFNMFVLWGMTKENALKTLKHNLDLRLLGGKAPMQVGCHTDYFTPIYDNGTLLVAPNTDNFGLVITNGWNDWRDRISAFEDFVDYGIEKNVYFWSGEKTIEYTRQLAQADQYGTEEAFNKDWTFFDNSSLGATSTPESATNSINATVSLPVKSGDDMPDAGFRTYFDAGTLAELDHISLNYNTTAPIAVRLIMDNDQPWEIWLNSLGNDVQSGRIPLSAFHYNQYADKALATNKRPNPADIVGIEFALLTAANKEEVHTLSITDVKVYKGKKSVGITDKSVNSVNQAGISFGGINAGKVNLSIAESGIYNVGLFTPAGRMIKSIDATSLTAGVNNVDLGSVTAGMYILRIEGETTNLVTKAMFH